MPIHQSAGNKPQNTLTSDERWNESADVILANPPFNPYSGVKTSILFMDKARAKKSPDILFVKVENDGYDLGAQRRRIEQNDLPQAARQIKAYLKGDTVHDAQNSANALTVAREKVNETVGWDLSGEKYREDAPVSRSDWPMVALEEILDYEQPATYVVSSADYSDNYETSVLTAGKTFILDRTNESDGIFPADKLPVIIFDDFTTAIKFVDFPFKVTRIQPASATPPVGVKGKLR